MSSTENPDQGPVIRDRRRIDPATGQVRESSQPRPGKHSASTPGGATAAEGSSADEAGSGAGNGAAARGPDDPTATMLAERTADLQRLQAEYANYRKRVERDRLAVREQALANVLHELLPVLDDIGRAREHGELSGGFKSVADSLDSILTKLGLTSYGENGDVFDPTLHEALMHEYSPDVTEPTCVKILQPGYKVGDRIIRPARVSVAEPGGDASPAPESDDTAPAPDATAPADAAPDDAAASPASPEGTDDGADD
jgi:molecular chaperone GrpE